MSNETVISVKWNPDKFKQIKGSMSRSEVAENIGFSEVYVDKLIAGHRKLSIDALESLCIKTNATPNDFFEIIVKNSSK